MSPQEQLVLQLEESQPPAQPLPPAPSNAWCVPNRRMSQSEQAEHEQRLLCDLLSLAVPLWVQRWRDEGRTLGDIMSFGSDAVIFAHHATALLWATRGEAKAPRLRDGTPARERARSTPEVFNMLARGVAAMSFRPGGIHIFGGHWESKPEWLRGAA